MASLIDHLAQIVPAPGGKYRMPAESYKALDDYLRPLGVTLDTLKGYDELISALWAANYRELLKAIDRPAPSPERRFIWRRLQRKIGLR